MVFVLLANILQQFKILQETVPFLLELAIGQDSEQSSNHFNDHLTVFMHHWKVPSLRVFTADVQNFDCF